jgi:hypothetical protein
MIQQCVDLALGRAFAPDPLDSTVPLARRFAGRPLVAVTMFKDGYEAQLVTFSGSTPRFGHAETCPAGSEEADAAFLQAFAERHKAKECLINLTTGYSAILSSRTRRPESDEEAIMLMRDSPERLLGEPPAQGCQHSLAYHPTHNFAVVFAHKENEIGAAVGLASRASLGLARLHCGMASLLINVIGRFWSEVGQESEILLVDRTSLFYLPVAEGSFGRPLFDIGLKESALKQAVAERIGRLKAGAKVILVDSSGLEVETMIRGRGVTASLSEPLKDQANPGLWACMSDEPNLGYDLFPNQRVVRPCAKGSLRFVPLLFWGSLAAAVVLMGINKFRSVAANRLSSNLEGQVQMLSGVEKQDQGLIHDVEMRDKSALAMRDWLLISPPTQSFLIDITKEIEAATDQGVKEGKTVAQLDSLSLTRQEGQPQMRLVLVVLGDAPAANRIFQRVSALFGRLGYSTVDLKESLVPQGFRYEHLLNIPKGTGL